MNIFFLLADAGHRAEQWHWPPLHPILVNFTASLIPVSVFSDVVVKLRPRDSLRSVGWWTLLYAACITPLTAASGWYWLRQMPYMDHQLMTLHKWLGTAIAALLVAVVWWRWASHRRQTTPRWSYLLAASLLMLAVVVQGHVGGTMTFGSGDQELSTSADQTRNADHPTVPTTTPARQAGGLEWKDHLDLKD